MKLLSRNHYSGTVTVERTVKKGNGTVVTRQNHTNGVGPFCRDVVHAQVGGTVSAKLSRNYHSVEVSVSVHIPAHPTEDGVDAAAAWCFTKAGDICRAQLVGANKALDKLATRHKD